MKLRKKYITSSVLCCLMILIEGCSAFALVDVWNDPSYHKSPLQKVMVIAIMKDSIQRRIWEVAFVSELSKHGVNAVSSYRLFPDAFSDANQVVETVRKEGFDGILVTHLLHEKTESHVEESIVKTEQLFRYNIYHKKYEVYYHNAQHPGYVESQIIDRRAIDIWMIANEEQMIWSGTSNFSERNSVEAVQNDIAELVIPELTRNAIIKSER